MPTHKVADVLANEALSESIYRIRVEQTEIAASVVPGQFVMIRPHGGTDLCWVGRWHFTTLG